MALDNTSTEYPYVFMGRVRLPERSGQPCKLVSLPLPGSFSTRATVEFEDGFRATVNRLNVRVRT